MSESMTKQEARELLRGAWAEKFGRLSSFFKCSCGQEVMVTNRPHALDGRDLAASNPAIVKAEESAECPVCGALLFPHWNGSMGLLMDAIMPAVEKTLDELEEMGDELIVTAQWMQEKQQARRTTHTEPL